MLNGQLVKKIEQVIRTHPHAINPRVDEDFIVQKIVSANSVRLKKEAIKVGVKEYMTVRARKEMQTMAVEEVGRPRKRVKKQQLQFEFEDSPAYKFERLGGVQETIDQIKKVLFVPIERREELGRLGTGAFRGFLLAGPVGSGKSLLASCVLSYMKNTFGFSAYWVHAGNLLGTDAEDSLKKLFQVAKESQPSVICIDDIDILCSKESSKRPQGSPSVSLAIQMDRVKEASIYLLATTSMPEKLDVALKKLNRFDKSLSINTSSDESRCKILTTLLTNIKHNLTPQQLLEFAKGTSGFMAADLVMLLKEAGLHALQSGTSSPILLTPEDISHSLTLVQPMLKKEGFTDIPTTTLEDVGGLATLKLELQRQIIIPMQQQHKFKLLNFDIQSGGVLLYGPPGCGKTMLAKAIANAVRANFIIVKGPELLNKYVGESEQAVREVFGRAQRASPCMIFFDEFDGLAPKRSDQGNQVTERVVNTLLAALDGVEERKMVFVIAATNRKDMIDEATLRAGRIQKHLYVPQPTEPERVDILRAITKKMKINECVRFEEIAKKTKGFSGADLKFLVKEAAVTAVMDNRTQVLQEDLSKALDQLLLAKRKNKLDDKTHEMKLRDQENEQYAFHFSSEQNNKEGELVKNCRAKKEQSTDLMGEFMEFLSYKLNRR